MNNYPIIQSASGPDCGKPAKCINPETGEVTKEYFTHCPIPLGKQFDVVYEGKLITFEIELHCYSDPDYIFVNIVDVVGE